MLREKTIMETKSGFVVSDPLSIVHKLLNNFNSFISLVFSNVFYFVKRDISFNKTSPICCSESSTENIQNVNNNINILVKNIMQNFNELREHLNRLCRLEKNQEQTMEGTDMKISYSGDIHECEEFREFYKDYTLISRKIQSIKSDFEKQKIELTKNGKKIDDLRNYHWKPVDDEIINIIQNQASYEGTVRVLMENFDESFNFSQMQSETIKSNWTESKSEQTQTQNQTQTVNNVESKIEVVTERNDEKTVSMHSLQSEYVTMKKTLITFCRDKVECQRIFDKTIKNLKGQIEKLTIQNKEKDESISKFEETICDISSLQNILKQKDEEILKYEQSQKTLYETVNRLQNYIRKLTAENEEAVKKWSNAQNQIGTINELQTNLNEKNVLIAKYEELINRSIKKRNDKVDYQQKKTVNSKTFLENKENLPISVTTKSHK